MNRTNGGIEEIVTSPFVRTVRDTTKQVLERGDKLILHVDDDEVYIAECREAIATEKRVYASARILPDLMQSSYWQEIAYTVPSEVDVLIVLDLHLQVDSPTQNATYLGQEFSGKDVYGVISDAKVRNLLPDNFKVLVHTSQEGEVGPNLEQVNADFIAGEIETHGLTKPDSMVPEALAQKIDQIYDDISPPINFYDRMSFEQKHTNR